MSRWQEKKFNLKLGEPACQHQSQSNGRQGFPPEAGRRALVLYIGQRGVDGLRFTLTRIYAQRGVLAKWIKILKQVAAVSRWQEKKFNLKLGEVSRQRRAGARWFYILDNGGVDGLRFTLTRIYAQRGPDGTETYCFACKTVTNCLRASTSFFSSSICCCCSCIPFTKGTTNWA